MVGDQAESAIEIREFVREDFPAYQSWFTDPLLNAQLGPMEDDEWLEFVLIDSTGIQYSVFRDGELVAVAGVTLPDSKHPLYVITDLAVRPAVRGQGIGRAVVGNLLSKHPLKQYELWVAYIAEKNPFAMKFFSQLGWVQQSVTPDDAGMFDFVYRP